MTEAYRIRVARTGEAEIVAEVEIRADRKMIGWQGYMGIARPARPEKFAPMIEDGRISVAIDQADTPIGFVAVAEMDGEAYLAELNVAIEHQGNGLGRRLAERAYQWAREHGFKTILLSTFRDIPWNAPYYARLGFEPVPPAEFGKPGIAAQREHEAKFNDMTRRVFMRKML